MSCEACERIKSERDAALARIEAVGDAISQHGCSCTCECAPGCSCPDVCFACQVDRALSPKKCEKG